MSDCLFCKIAAKQIPAKLVHEDDELIAFRDIAPQAPTHILLIPKRHVASLAELDDPALAGRMLLAARHIAVAEGLHKTGWRTVFNTGPDGGQTVHHLHVHILGGRAMTWPPG
jgi:histidine triad (HIT) family protein